MGRRLRRDAARTVSFAALTLWLPATALAAQPDSPPAETVGLDEVVVTARRIEENLQEVPVTVTALSGEQLKAQNVLQATDLQFVAPSVTVGARLGRLGGSFTVRGLNSGVVSYFSEVPGGPVQTGMPFFDLASVQVLNGPQGTLFGRTAAAGAVLVTPQHPQLDGYSGYADVSVGDYGRLQATGAVNVPLIADELALRAVYHHEHVGGFTKQLAPTQIIPGLPNLTDLGEKLDEINSESFRLGLEWKRGDFRSYTVYSHLRVKQAPAGHVLTYANPNLPILNLTPAQAATTFGPVCNQAFANRLVTSVAGCVSDRLAITQQLKSALVAEAARIQNGGDKAVRYTPAFQGLTPADDLRHDSIINISEYDFGDLGFTTLRAKNVISHLEDSHVTSYEVDGVGGILIGVAATTIQPSPPAESIQVANTVIPRRGTPVRTITEEFQLQGRAVDMIDWTAGFYYQKANFPVSVEGISALSRTFSGVSTQNQGWTAASNFPAGSDGTERAAYGQATVDFDKIGVHGLSLTGGFRRTQSKATARLIQAVANPSGTGPFVPGARLPDTVTKSTGDNYTIALNEQLTDNVLLYASTSKSFTPGGTNLFNGCNIAPNCKPVFDPQTVKNYEIGVKTEFPLGEARVRLNADAYRMDFENIQQQLRFTSGATAISYIANVASARMQGLELHMDAALANWDLTANYSYLDADYREWIAADLNGQSLPTDVCQPGSAGSLCLLDLHKSPFVNAPAHQLSGNVRYHLPIDEAHGDAWVLLSAYHQSKQYLTPAAFREIDVARGKGLGDITNAITQDAYTTLNLRVGWDRILGSTFSAAVFVNNLTDTTFAQSGSTRAYSTGSAVKLYSAPRMWGINLVYRFGS
ncbi:MULTISPECIES: TonB-dependent receptor [unclassified Phenylobacterium]|uniref:TonB-dependent receptor n=1 Tax=unclassified Phenylobacterium TaxID=2640670 RepID=UPI0009EBF30F|nr:MULTISPECIES: TonB-dependent receptor [unclassified Phenylobacterium]